MTRLSSNDLQRSQGGFTLIELMAVVAIMSVLSALAIISTGDRAHVQRAAQAFAGQIGEASRQAHMAGPVPESVASAEGYRARTRILINETGGNQFVAVDLRNPLDDISSSYFELSSKFLPNNVDIVGYEADIARTESGGTVTALPAPYELECQPNGQCGPVTFYLQSTEDAGNRWRVAVLPLASAPVVLQGW